MEGLQHHYARSYLHDVNNVKRMNNNNKMLVSRSSTNPSLYSYEPSSSRERYGTQTVTKSKHTWWWNDPERKRKRRVAKYKLIATEGKIKHSVKKGFRWLKVKCIKIVRNL